MAEHRYVLRGEIDLARRDEIQADLADLIAIGGDVLIDCAQMTFIDSTGIGVIVNACEALRARGHDLLLVNVAPAPRRVFEVTGLTDLLRYDRPRGRARRTQSATAALD